eukprot:8356205-Pyramimonas_sp.AAC.1
MAIFNAVGPAKRHPFQVSGGTVVAEPRAQRFRGALRNGKEWRTVHLSLANGARVPLDVSADKSPKAVRAEVQ